MSAISKPQIKKIKTLQRALDMSDESYRSLIMSINEDGFAASCTDLTSHEAGVLIEIMEKQAETTGTWEKRAFTPLGKRVLDADVRDGFATPKQQAMLYAMFRQKSWFKNNRKAFDHALRNFLNRIVHVSDLRFLKREDVQKVRLAIENLSTNKPQKEAF